MGAIGWGVNGAGFVWEMNYKATNTASYVYIVRIQNTSVTFAVFAAYPSVFLHQTSRPGVARWWGAVAVTRGPGFVARACRGDIPGPNEQANGRASSEVHVESDAISHPGMKFIKRPNSGGQRGTQLNRGFEQSPDQGV